MRRKFPRQSEVRKAPGSVALLAVAEERAEDAGDALVPGQLAEGFGLGDADELGGLGAVAQVRAVSVGEEIDGGAVDELEALLGDALPVVGRDALAADAPGDGDELQVEIVDPQLVDQLAHLRHLLGAAGGVDEGFDVGRTVIYKLSR